MAPVSGVQGIRRIAVPWTGTITQLSLFFANSTPGTNENVVINVRKNSTTDYLVTSTADMSTSPAVISNLAMNIPVARGDFIEIKIAYPAMVTYPISGIGGYALLITGS